VKADYSKNIKARVTLPTNASDHKMWSKPETHPLSQDNLRKIK
jgi:hypothetical protein